MSISTNAMSQPFFSLDLKEKIDYISLSPYDWSKSLICIALRSKVVVGIVKFQEEYDDIDNEVEFEVLEDFYHGHRVHSIAWSPNSSLNKLPLVVELCVAGNDFSLRVFSSDLTAKRHSRKEIQGHADYINDCRFDPEGEYLASVSDDLTCKLWTAWPQFEHMHTFHLTSPGMSVCWQNEQPGKLLVAEKKGLFRIYNTLTLSPILSIVCSPTPLVAAEWCLRHQHVAFLAAGQLFRVDITVPGHAIEMKSVHPEGGFKIAVCRANQNYIATAGRPNNCVKITNIKTKLTVLTTNLKLFGGFAWHNRLPVLCVADNSTLSFYKISPK